MGLEELEGMDTPDNKGGRPPKEEQEDETLRVAEGEPFTVGKDNSEWWQEQLDHILKDKDSIEECIPGLAGRVFMHPIEVRKKLELHGIHETDWEAYIDEYPMYEDDSRIQGRLSAAGVDTTSNTSSSSNSDGGVTLFGDSDDSSTDDDDDDLSSGLSSMIDG